MVFAFLLIVGCWDTETGIGSDSGSELARLVGVVGVVDSQLVQDSCFFRSSISLGCLFENILNFENLPCDVNEGKKIFEKNTN